MSETSELLSNFHSNYKIYNRIAIFQSNANVDDEKIYFTKWNRHMQLHMPR